MIYNSDNTDITAGLQDNSIDLILTDPPYQTTDLNWDSSPDTKTYADFMRILKPTGWFFCFGSLDMYCNIRHSGWRLKFNYVWIKPNSVMQTKDTIRPRMQHEHIFAFIQPDAKPSKLYFDSVALRTPGKSYTVKCKPSKPTESMTANRYDMGMRDGIYHHGPYREGTTILYAPNKAGMKKTERTPHPTQKPISLLETIVKGYCPVNGVVYDPFMGSGSVGVACQRHNRQFIGVEINHEYYNIAKQRLSNVTLC